MCANVTLVGGCCAYVLIAAQSLSRFLVIVSVNINVSEWKTLISVNINVSEWTSLIVLPFELFSSDSIGSEHVSGFS